MTTTSDISTIAHLIQLSVTPAFLLTALGAMLGVMTNRLGRIIDRARLLENRIKDGQSDNPDQIHADLKTLSRRATLINRAIALCTTAALLVSSVIGTLFFSAFFSFEAAKPIAVLFICAMLAFVAGLIHFLREIFTATANLRIGLH